MAGRAAGRGFLPAPASRALVPPLSVPGSPPRVAGFPPSGPGLRPAGPGDGVGAALTPVSRGGRELPGARAAATCCGSAGRGAAAWGCRLAGPGVGARRNSAEESFPAPSGPPTHPCPGPRGASKPRVCVLPASRAHPPSCGVRSPTLGPRPRPSLACRLWFLLGPGNQGGSPHGNGWPRCRGPSRLCGGDPSIPKVPHCGKTAAPTPVTETGQGPGVCGKILGVAAGGAVGCLVS